MCSVDHRDVCEQHPVGSDGVVLRRAGDAGSEHRLEGLAVELLTQLARVEVHGALAEDVPVVAVAAEPFLLADDPRHPEEYEEIVGTKREGVLRKGF